MTMHALGPGAVADCHHRHHGRAFDHHLVARRQALADQPAGHVLVAQLQFHQRAAVIVAAAFAPLALLFRYAVLTPLSFLIPPLRRIVVERYSGMIINPLFRRKPPEGEFRRQWAWQEGGAWAWSSLLIAACVFGWVPLRALLAKEFTLHTGADVELAATPAGLRLQAGANTAEVEAARAAVTAARDKLRYPTAATAGMLLLARAGTLAQVGDWTRNLMQWFPALPDAAVLWAESLRSALAGLRRTHE